MAFRENQEELISRRLGAVSQLNGPIIG